MVKDILTEEERKKMNFHAGELKKCPQCGKKFYIARTNSDVYTYRRKIGGRERYFCSWSCFRRWE